MVETITQAASDFTNRDFDSWILELRARANAAFPGWTDFNTPNFGNILLEMFAHTLDVLSFTQDQQFLETRVVFAQLRRSMIALGKNVGFRLPGATVATVDLEITIADGQARADPITIPAGTVVRTLDVDNLVEFDLSADAVIPAGQIQISDAAAENARERTEDFVAAGVPDDSFPLGFIPYVDGSAVVVVGVDVFVEQDNLFSSGPTDKHFFVEVDDQDRATIRFGDGINGEIPVGAVSVTYKTGGGSGGNVDANTLVEFDAGNSFPSAIGENVQLLVRNPSGASGGVDRMSVEEARIAIPASIRTEPGRRSVTQQDFEDNAKKVRGVSRAMMLTSDDVASIDENTGELYIVPVGGGLPSAALKTEVKDFIDENFPPCLTFTFTVEDPVLNIISVSAEVYLRLGETEAVARAAVETALDEFFALNNADGSQNDAIDFGLKLKKRQPTGAVLGEVPWSDIFNAVRDAVNPDTGLLVFRKVEEDTFVPADDVPIDDTEFPVLGSILLTNGDTGLPF